MATPASGVKPTNASQAIKGSEKSSMSPEFLSGDKNSKQDAAKKGLRNLEQESAAGGFYNNGAGEDAGDVDASRFSENNPDSGYTNAVSGYDDEEEDDEEDEPSRARKGPLVAILGAILTLGAVMGGSQAMLPFSLLEQLKSTYDSISTSMQSRSRVFLRKQLSNGNLEDPIKKKYFGFMKGSGATFSLSEKQRTKLESEGIHTADIKDADGNTRTIMLFDDGSGNLKVVTPDAALAEDISAGKVTIGDDITFDGMRVDTSGAMDFETKFSDSADFRNGYIKSSRTWRGAIGAWFDTMTVRFLQSNNLTRNRFKDFQNRVNAEAEGNTRGQIIADMMRTGKQDVDMESGERNVNATAEGQDADGNTIRTGIEEIDADGNYLGSTSSGETIRLNSGTVEISGEPDLSTAKMDINDAKGNFQKIVKTQKAEYSKGGSSAANMAVNSICAVTAFIGTVQVAIAAQQGLQLIQLVSSYFEAIDKVKAGDGVDSPINEMSTWLTQPADVIATERADNALENYSDDGFYETKDVVKKTGTTAMQSEGIAYLYGGGRINPSDPSVENFNIASKIEGVMKGIGAGMSTFAACAAAKMTTAIIGAISDVVELITCLIPGVGWAKCLFDMGAKFVGSVGSSIAIATAISSAAKVLAPIFISAFTKDLLSGIAGEDLGNALVSGSNIFMSANARNGGQAVASRDAYIAYRVEQEKVLAEKARYERETLSPFDASSPNTFLGSLTNQLIKFSTTTSAPANIISFAGGIVSSAFKSLLPTASAIDISEDIMTKEEFENLCPTLASIGAIGDAYCNPYVITDTSTLGMDPEDVVDKIKSQLIDKGDDDPETGKIKKYSNLANYILYCDGRSSTFGVADTNIAQHFEKLTLNIDPNTGTAVGDYAVDTLSNSFNAAVGAIPIVGDAVDIISNGNQLYNMGWISGESCVIDNTAATTIDASINSELKDKIDDHGRSIDWEEAKYYQRFVEDQRLLESMDSDYKSVVSIFLDEYYEENPLDDSYEGILARASGLSKETIVAMLDYVNYQNYIANYDPETRYSFVDTEDVDGVRYNIQKEEIDMPAPFIAVIRNTNYGMMRVANITA